MHAIKEPNGDRVAELVHDSATKNTDDILLRLKTCANGLTEEEAAERLEVFGPNEVAYEKKEGWLYRLYVSARNPLVILLTLLATLSLPPAIFAPAQ